MFNADSVAVSTVRSQIPLSPIVQNGTPELYPSIALVATSRRFAFQPFDQRHGEKETSLRESSSIQTAPIGSGTFPNQ